MMVVQPHGKCLVRLCERGSGGIHNCQGRSFAGSRRINLRCIEVTPLRSVCAELRSALTGAR